MAGRPIALVAGLLLTAGCGGDDPATPDPGGQNPPPVERPAWPHGFLVGGDISALARIEQGGTSFSVDGVEMDAIAALRTRGATLFRLRLFVAPSGADVQVNDLAYTIALAQRVVDSGAALLLDFHYSDTWADPAHQTPPAAWAALEFDSLEATVESYSRDVVAAMKDAGVLPDLVQIGKEIDAGRRSRQGSSTLYVDERARVELLRGPRSRSRCP